eukprot:CAMPEP_0168456294 /NCGR_PEP_ID=MMETSP0228-20121227/51215_1 /TAXON_ID=133427 /ORGANISM="Protoceratium reticulatum, Strain CCCM 535 (=CCMP 1889)" /LENGTH=81 /DNA_ID=CAMNT_0008471213 /DNA_START=252 /DNA_END=494 /DNA_ORIENTATION=-
MFEVPYTTSSQVVRADVLQGRMNKLQVRLGDHQLQPACRQMLMDRHGGRNKHGLRDVAVRAARAPASSVVALAPCAVKVIA